MATMQYDLVLDPTVALAPKWRLPAAIPELDGLRGLAILLVLICHSAFWVESPGLRSFFGSGRVGVDLFFVLSGFLITGILLDTRNNRRRTRDFYIRRGLRIWPLYFVFLLLAVLLLRRMLPPQLHLWAYVLFVQNFFYYEAAGAVLQPTWSLAVEEQFYAVWPWIAFRTRPRTVLKICFAVLVFSPLVRLAFYKIGGSDQFFYVNTLFRLDGIAMGGLLADWVRDPVFNVDRMKHFANLAVIFAGAGAVITLAAADQSVVLKSLSYSFTALMFGGVVALALRFQGEDIPYTRFFRQSWLMYLGKVSFALYLFNFPIYLMMHGNHAMSLLTQMGLSGLRGQFTLLVVENAVLMLAVWISWNMLESPLLKLKSRLAPRSTPRTSP